MTEYQNPVINHCFPGDGFLLLEWTNYIPQIVYTSDEWNSDAYITIVDHTNASMRYVYLTETELFDEAYKVTGLTNGKRYSVQLTQTLQGANTDIDTTATQYDSNTVFGTPKPKPNQPIILMTGDYIPIVTQSEDQSWTLQITVDYQKVNGIEEDLDKIIFKFVDNLNYNITSKKQNVDREKNTSRHIISNLTAANYFISCLTINENGSSDLSNTVEISIGDKPAVTDITEVISGNDSQLTVSAELVDNYDSNYYADGLELEYKSLDDANYTTIDISMNDEILYKESGTVKLTNYDISNLVNGSKYMVRARGYYIASDGSKVYGEYSRLHFGTPAIMCEINSVQIEATVSGQMISYSISSNVSTYNKKFALVLNGTPIETIDVNFDEILTTERNFTFEIAAGDVVQLSVTPYHIIPDTTYWENPSLRNDDEWVGSEVSSDNLTVLDVPPPASEFHATGFSDDSNNLYEVTVEWTAPTTIDENAQLGYSLNLYKVTNGVRTLLVGPVPADDDDTSFTFQFSNGLSAGQELVATIEAYNDIGYSELLNSTSFHWYYTYEGYASGLSAYQTGPQTITMSWSKAAEQAGYVFDSYVLVYNITDSDPSEPITIESQSVESNILADTLNNEIVLSNVSKDFSFTLTTKFTDQYGNIIEDTSTSSSIQIGGKPNEVAAFGLGDFSANQLRYYWQEVDGNTWDHAEKYHIELSETSTFPSTNTPISQEIPNDSNATDDGYWFGYTFSNNLVLGQSYYARIWAENRFGVSDFVTTGPHYTANKPISPVEDVTLTIVQFKVGSETHVKLVAEWTPWIETAPDSEKNVYTFNIYMSTLYQNDQVLGYGEIFTTPNGFEHVFPYSVDYPAYHVGDTFYVAVEAKASVNGVQVASSKVTSPTVTYAIRPTIRSVILDHEEGTERTIVTIEIDNNYSELTDLATQIVPDSEFEIEDSFSIWNLVSDRIESETDSNTVSTYSKTFNYDTFKIDGVSAVLVVTSNGIGFTILQTLGGSNTIVGSETNGTVQDINYPSPP
jgi:hypothetical protein